MTDARVLRIARERRYRPIPPLIGRRIELTSLASLEGALRALVSRYVPFDPRWQPPEMLEGGLAKYGGASPRTPWLHPEGA